MNSLDSLVNQVGVGGVPVNPLVRLAPNPTAGILEAIKEERADLLLLGWEGEDPPGDTPPDPILKRAPCDVAVLHGHFPQTVKRVLVPTAGGPYAPVALKLGLALTSYYDNITQAFGTLYFLIIALMLPNIAYFIPSWNPAWITYIPTYPMLEGFKEILLTNTNSSFVLLSSLGFLAAGAAFFLFANMRFKKTLTI